MLRFIVVLFAVTFVSPLQALPAKPIQIQSSMATPVREACGAGMHRVNGVCVRNVKACPVGFHLSSGRCVKT
jgi:hypothetical protein